MPSNTTASSATSCPSWPLRSSSHISFLLHFHRPQAPSGPSNTDVEAAAISYLILCLHTPHPPPSPLSLPATHTSHHLLWILRFSPSPSVSDNSLDSATLEGTTYTSSCPSGPSPELRSLQGLRIS